MQPPRVPSQLLGLLRPSKRRSGYAFAAGAQTATCLSTLSLVAEASNGMAEVCLMPVEGVRQCHTAKDAATRKLRGRPCSP